MLRNRKWIMGALLITGVLFVLGGCNLINDLLGNTPPVANAGQAQSVQVGALVALNGTNSSDPQNLQLTYAWSFISTPPGSTVQLTKTSEIIAYFTPDVAGIYVVQLKVDNGKASATVKVTITATGGGVPLNVQAAAADGQVTVTWTSVVGATSYNLYYAAGSTVSKSSAGNTRLSGVSSPKIVAGLTNGTQYAFVVTAIVGASESAESAVATATPSAATSAPPAPSNVLAAASDGQVTVTWTSVTGATSYNLYYVAGSTVAKSTAGATKVPGVSSPQIVVGLTNGTPYAFVVTALNGIGEGVDSTVATATPAAASAAPSAPATVQATPGDGAVSLVWTPVSNATSYTVYYKQGATVTKTDFTQKIPGLTSTSFTKFNLANGTNYTFIVTASNSQGESGASTAITATPAAATTPPAAPANLIAVSAQGQVTISWDPLADATSYTIYWNLGTTVTKASLNKSQNVQPPKTIAGLIDGQQYAFIVTASNPAGESAASTVVMATPQASGTPPSAPVIFSVAPGDSQVTLSWYAVSGATSYNVYYQYGSTVTKATGTKVSNVWSPKSIGSLTNGSLYAFIVTAVNSAGETESAMVTAVPQMAQVPPTTPSGLAASPTTSEINLSWNSSPGAYGYYVYRSTTPGAQTYWDWVPASGTTTVTYSDTYVQAGIWYYYKVSAYNGYGESMLSYEVPGKTVDAGTIGIGIQ